MKTVTKETVKYISELIRIFIPEEELDSYFGDLKTSLTPAETFDELDTSDIEITSQTLKSKNVLRDDVAKTGLTQEEALSNTKNSKDGYFVVKKVI